MEPAALFFEDRSGAAGSASEVAPWNQEDAANNRESSPSCRTTVALDGIKKRPRARQAAWVDEDDAKSRVNLNAQRRTRKLRKTQKEGRIDTGEYAQRIREFYASNVTGQAGGLGQWATLPQDSENEDGEQEGSMSESDHETAGLEQSVQKLLRKSGQVISRQTRTTRRRAVVDGNTALRAGIINIQRFDNINLAAPNKSITHTVEFHPSGKLVLTAGLDSTIRIFQRPSGEKVQGIHMADLRLLSAHFTCSGDAVVASGSRAFCYRFDMTSGEVSKVPLFSQERNRSAPRRFVVSKDGSLLAFMGDASARVTLVAAKSMQQTGHLYVPGEMVSAAFDTNDDSKYLYTVQRDGLVQLWDIRRMECVDQHRDEGTVHATAIATSPGHYAVGSDTGIVNIYSNNALGGAQTGSIGTIRTAKPVKCVDNLTTPISSMAFNHDGQILAVGSRLIKQAIRLVHTPSMTVFSNWPRQRDFVRRVQSLAFSPAGGFLAVGNDKGDALMYRVRDYPQG